MSSRATTASGGSSRTLLRIFLACLLLVSTLIAIRAKLWLDEIYSFYIVNQRTALDIIAAIREGCDGPPPLYALIVFGLKPLLGVSALALRIPSVIGFSAACGCFYLFLARRFPPAYSGLAMLLFCYKAFPYSFEARPYGVLLGVAAAAMVAWQTTREGRSRPWSTIFLSISLAVAIALHYYAVFLVVPFVVGEVTAWRVCEKRDLTIMFAIMCPVLVLLPHWQLIQTSRRFVPYFWSKPDFPSSVLLPSHGVYAYPVALVIAVLSALAWRKRAWKPMSHSTGQKQGLRPYESAFAIVLGLMPYVLILAAALTSKIYMDRYVLWAMFGILALATGLLFWAAQGSSTLPTVLLCCVAVLLAVRWANTLRHPPGLGIAEAANRRLQLMPPKPEPIFVADHGLYMVLSFYAEPAIRNRLVYADSPELERLYTHADTGPLLLAALRRRAPLRIPDFTNFLATTPRFLLIANPHDWQPSYLIRKGYKLTLLCNEDRTLFYDVSASPGLRS